MHHGGSIAAFSTLYTYCPLPLATSMNLLSIKDWKSIPTIHDTTNTANGTHQILTYPILAAWTPLTVFGPRYFQTTQGQSVETGPCRARIS